MILNHASQQRLSLQLLCERRVKAIRQHVTPSDFINNFEILPSSESHILTQDSDKRQSHFLRLPKLEARFTNHKHTRTEISEDLQTSQLTPQKKNVKFHDSVRVIHLDSGNSSSENLSDPLRPLQRKLGRMTQKLEKLSHFSGL